MRHILGAFDAVHGAAVVEAELVEGGGRRGDAPASVRASEGGLLEAGDDGGRVRVDGDESRLAGDARLHGREAGVVEATVGFEVVVGGWQSWHDGEVVVLSQRDC